jgi:molybdopterin/thiamine biosynthesis adenylyltransferase
MAWWITDPVRARSEQAAVAELAEGAGWLSGIRWYVGDGLALCVDFDVSHRAENFSLTMTYSALHPHAPPRVVPRDGGRLSGHQYADGQMCLEYRPDNWLPSISGAMLIASTHRLIAGERGEGNRRVPSAHHVTLGQRTRGQPFRFLLMPEAERRLASIPGGTSVEALLSERKRTRTFVSTLVAMDGETVLGAWEPGAAGASQYPARVVSLNPVTPKRGLTVDQLATMLAKLGLREDETRVRTLGDGVFVVLASPGNWVVYYLYDSKGVREGVEYETLSVTEQGRRLPEAYDALLDKTVGIVGAGSLGSKVAVMLARTGFGRFVLIDDDVFLPGNLVRNELGLAAIGVHKVDALAARLMAVRGKVDVTRRRVPLGGQESSGTTDSVMSDLAGCDVIVDATADPHAFNFCAAVALRNRRPLVWGEVYAGGIGGLVARVRPDREPEPQVARSQIAAWFETQGIPAQENSGADPYGGGPDGTWVADDAEVSVVAAHLARLATDALARAADTIFPSPAYVIALRAGWMFTAPFETWPIDLPGATEWSPETTAASVEQSLALIRELMPAVADDDDQPAA